MHRYEWATRWNIAPVEVDIAIRTVQALERIAEQLAQIDKGRDHSAQRQQEK
jgi:hypothetical protein